MRKDTKTTIVFLGCLMIAGGGSQVYGLIPSSDRLLKALFLTVEMLFILFSVHSLTSKKSEKDIE